MKSENSIDIIPAPAQLSVKRGRCELSSRVLIAADEAARPAANHLAQVLGGNKQRSVDVVFESASGPQTRRPGRPVVRMALTETTKSPEASGPSAEAYRLEIAPEEILVTAAAPAGFLWAVETIRQLLLQQIASNSGEEAVSLPCVTVEDRPRFGWRGFHFDVSRHFFPVAFIEKLIDLIALYKLNRFHWHLTDDQGWRIEIKSHPELTAVGAWRADASGGRYGGYYSREDIERVVSYAEGRGITVIPEIEMPGHAQAALAAYPHLSCRGEPITISGRGGISKDVFCAGKEATFQLLGEVLDEVSELFPSKLIHVGGDECPKDRWRECPACRERIRTEGLANEDELQSYFIRRIEAHLAKRGKRLIGWDEILEGGLAPDATVMSWRGVQGGVTAAKAGHDVVMSPVTHCYFDYRQSANPGELGPDHFHPPVTTLRKVYQYEPIPPALSPEEARRVLGAQANLWTESVPTPERAEYMTFPRICALAEVLWSLRDARDWESFKGRLASHAAMLDLLAVNYCHISESF